jgi:hypothetical protein
MASTEDAAQKLYDDPETGEKISKSECVFKPVPLLFME